MKLPWWDQRAIDLQKSVIDSDAGDKKLELLGLEQVPVTPFEVRKAVLHIRHDMVLLWSSLSSVNVQLQWIRNLLLVAVMLLAYLAFRA